MTVISHFFLCLVVLLAFGATQDSIASDEQLAKGTFLVAADHLTDSHFSQSVIYLVAYSRRGAMGVIVNRPTDVQLAQALPHLEDQPHAQDVIYAGGPVGRTRMLLLIRSKTFPLEDVLPITDEVAASASLDNLAVLTEEAGSQFHVYAGYAGWSPGQLDSEVARGDWLVLPGDPATLFGTDLTNLWSTLRNKGDTSGAEWVHYRQPLFPLDAHGAGP